LKEGCIRGIKAPLR